MTAPSAVKNLIDIFHRNRDAYRSPAYNETQLRRQSLTAAQIPNEKTALQRQIQTTDQQIDKLVHEQCDLTGEDIWIV